MVFHPCKVLDERCAALDVSISHSLHFSRVLNSLDSLDDIFDVSWLGILESLIELLIARVLIEANLFAIRSKLFEMLCDVSVVVNFDTVFLNVSLNVFGCHLASCDEELQS